MCYDHWIFSLFIHFCRQTVVKRHTSKWSNKSIFAWGISADKLLKWVILREIKIQKYPKIECNYELILFFLLGHDSVNPTNLIKCCWIKTIELKPMKEQCCSNNQTNGHIRILSTAVSVESCLSHGSTFTCIFSICNGFFFYLSRMKKLAELDFCKRISRIRLDLQNFKVKHWQSELEQCFS